MARQTFLPLLLRAAAAALVLLAVRAPAAEMLPDVTLTDLDHHAVRLQDFRGRVVLIDMVASWCLVCRQSLPFYAELKRSYGDAVVVIAVSTDRDADDARTWSESLPPEIRMVHDPDRDGCSTLGMRAMPTLLIVDRNGQIRKRIESFDPDDRPAIQDLVRQLVAEPSTSP